MGKLFKSMFRGIIMLVIIIFIITGCSSKNTIDSNISFKDLETKIKGIANMSNMNVGDMESLESLYGINKDEIEDFIFYTSTTNIKADEIVVLKVKDSSKIDEIKAKISKRIDEQTMKFQDYLPEEYYLIEKHILKSKNDCILFVILEEAENVEKVFDKEIQ
ncbi:DUF4358 domain-containing protein [Wansuia hejianensis]|uniref:DUF4358 domain-containing protein n=1 Tax=Wansuia hejianensis TaxID=2763667 RepID=A0A926EYX3_9FIRM|nr:DUF4358 domain-containing protein [Wansuia hejianensis]MBC8590918.1 DUF4358 domain-containing protein [Wansuia hejianensis]